MKAKQFIEQYGWEFSINLSKNMVGINQEVANYIAVWGQYEWDKLKQLVDAWELVNKWNGVDAMNELIAWEMEHHTNGGNGNKDLPNKKVIDRLKKAIKLVESVK